MSMKSGEQSVISIFLCSENGNILYASDAPDGIINQVRKAVNKFVRNGSRDRQKVERLGTGSLELCLVVHDDFHCVLAIYSLHTNLEEHWRIAELKKLSLELESIFQTSHDGIVVADSTGTYIRINPSYQRISGLNIHDIIGRTGEDIVAAGLVSASATMQVLQTGQPVTLSQVFLNGNKSYITATPLFDEKGNIFRVVTNVRDTTEIQNLQTRLMQSQAQLNKFSQIVRKLTLNQEDIVFRSLKMRQVKDDAVKFAQVDAPLLIIGETGVGKEAVADFIHKHSKRSDKPFLKINCAAIPEHLLEAELFGYEGGAFTGANKGGQPGLLEIANNGMVMLDELGELPSVLQAKLLRFLEHQEFYRVGSKKPSRVNVRILAATNSDLEEMVKQKTFRMDLFYRLNVLRIHIPALRERTDDIPALTEYFLQQTNQRYGQEKTLAPDIYRYFLNYTWPGNVRELKHIVERLVIISDNKIIDPKLLPAAMLIFQMEELPMDGHLGYQEAKDNFERSFWRRVQNLYPTYRKAAKALKVNHSTVIKKLARYGTAADKGRKLPV
jgi:PAS domain S-box-containing protein